MLLEMEFYARSPIGPTLWIESTLRLQRASRDDSQGRRPSPSLASIYGERNAPWLRDLLVIPLSVVLLF